MKEVLYAKQCWDVNRCLPRKRAACPYYRSRAADKTVEIRYGKVHAA